MNTYLKNKSISVLGCGWLGLALAKALVAEKAAVRGSTTSKEKLLALQKAGLEPFLVDLARETPIPDRFAQVKSLVISFPPKAVNGNYEPYLSQLKRLVSELENSGLEQVIFISSTGVYPENSGNTTEDMAAPHSDRAKALLHAEEIAKSLSDNRTTVLRFGGLFGPGRHPGRFLAGKTGVPNGAALINFIHQADAVSLIKLLIEHEITGQIFHACADEHPTREVFYTRAAMLIGLAPPQFCNSEKADFTCINSSKIKHALGYEFQYPDPLAALVSLPLPKTTH